MEEPLKNTDFILDSRDVKRTICNTCTQRSIILTRVCKKLGIKGKDITEWLMKYKRGKDITHDNIKRIFKEMGITLKITLVLDENFEPDKGLLKGSPLGSHEPVFDGISKEKVLSIQVSEDMYNRIISGEQTEYYVPDTEYWRKTHPLRNFKCIDVFARTDRADIVRLVVGNALIGVGKPEWGAPKNEVAILKIYLHEST